jgi:carbonic anhydrase/acetyltransferase-like protein (isoleucine patch superfamily)
MLKRLLAKHLKMPSDDASYLKTIYCNYRRNLRTLPFIIYPKTHFYISPHAHIIDNGGQLQLGCRFRKTLTFKQSEFIIEGYGTLEFKGTFLVHAGSSIIVESGGKLILGRGGMNRCCSLVVSNSISIGDNVFIGDNSIIRDNDYHFVSGGSNGSSVPVNIGNNVWIGMNVTILKGVTIGDGAVVATKSLVNKSVPPNTMVGGIPAKVIRENVTWKS